MTYSELNPSPKTTERVKVGLSVTNVKRVAVDTASPKIFIGVITTNQMTAEKLKERIKRSQHLQAMSKDDTLRLRKEHVGPSVALWFESDPLKMVRGKGQYMYDEMGNEYLDCINNVAHVGHGNTRVLEAVTKQLSLLNTNSRFLHDNLSMYAKRLTSTFPPHLSVCYLVNSGSEANDLAIRLARAYTGKKDIVAVEGAYHGNLTSTMSISNYKLEKLDESHRAKWAHVATLPCAYRGKYSSEQLRNDPDTNTIGRLYARDAETLIEEKKTAGRRVAAVIVESMISCGGQFPLPPGYLRSLQTYLRRENSLLICDEVQTGFGRCGKHMWAFQLDGDDIMPDIVTIGKPMGNGFPVSAVVTTPVIANAFKNIGTEYFNTFGGNPVSCAAALAVLDELQHSQLIQQADKVGTYIMEQLRDYKEKRESIIVGDVRGFGYFIGVEIVEDVATKIPAPKYAQFLVQRFRDERILMSTEGKHGNVMKFKPPMNFDMKDARRFLSVFIGMLSELDNAIKIRAKQQRAEPTTIDFL